MTIAAVTILSFFPQVGIDGVGKTGLWTVTETPQNVVLIPTGTYSVPTVMIADQRFVSW